MTEESSTEKVAEGDSNVAAEAIGLPYPMGEGVTLGTRTFQQPPTLSVKPSDIESGDVPPISFDDEMTMKEFHKLLLAEDKKKPKYKDYMLAKRKSKEEAAKEKAAQSKGEEEEEGKEQDKKTTKEEKAEKEQQEAEDLENYSFFREEYDDVDPEEVEWIASVTEGGSEKNSPEKNATTTTTTNKRKFVKKIIDSPYNATQRNLLRFLRARKFVIPDAFIMYKKAMKWRIDHRVDDILKKADPLEDVFQCICPHRNHMWDREGHPVYVERTGLIKVHKMLEHMSEDQIVERHIRHMEFCMQRLKYISKVLGKPIEKLTLVYDFAHLQYTVETAGLRCFRRTTSIDQDFYPERLFRMFIVNAPLTFRGVWAIIKPWLDAKTQSKIVIVGEGYQKQLHEIVAPEFLPPLLGGTCQCRDAQNGDGCIAEVRKWPMLSEEEQKVENERKKKKDAIITKPIPPARWILDPMPSSFSGSK